MKLKTSPSLGLPRSSLSPGNHWVGAERSIRAVFLSELACFVTSEELLNLSDSYTSICICASVLHLYPEGHSKGQTGVLGFEMSAPCAGLSRQPEAGCGETAKLEAMDAAQRGNTGVESQAGVVLARWRLGVKWDRVGRGLSPGSHPWAMVSPVLPPLPCAIHQSLPYM